MQKIKVGKKQKQLLVKVDGKEVYITIGIYGGVFVHYGEYGRQVHITKRTDGGIQVDGQHTIVQ